MNGRWPALPGGDRVRASVPERRNWHMGRCVHSPVPEPVIRHLGRCAHSPAPARMIWHKDIG